MAKASEKTDGAAREKHEQTIHVRLTKDELAMLDTRWRSAGFKNRSGFIRHVVRSEIDAPTTTPTMLDELRGLHGQIAALGRNLNQTVRAINEQRKKGAKFDPRSHLEIEDIEGLQAVTKTLRGTLETFITGMRERRVGRS